MSQFSIEEIREHLQDFPSKNFLLDEEEFTDDQIAIGFRDAVDSFNSFPPAHIMFVGGFTNPTLKSIILEGTLARIYRGKALLSTKNRTQGPLGFHSVECLKTTTLQVHVMKFTLVR